MAEILSMSLHCKSQHAPHRKHACKLPICKQVYQAMFMINYMAKILVPVSILSANDTNMHTHNFTLHTDSLWSSTAHSLSLSPSRPSNMVEILLKRTQKMTSPTHLSRFPVYLSQRYYLQNSFLFLNKNLCCDPSLEPFRQDDSDKGSQLSLSM